MFALLFYMIIGAIAVFFASTNVHLVAVNLGLVVVQAPLFLMLGIAFFSGFALAVILVLAKAARGMKRKEPSKDIVLRPR